MSSEARKNCRLQGKYSEKNLQYDKTRRSLEKRLKDSPTEKETQEKKFLKRKSDETKEGTSFSSENNETSLEYQENSEYSFSQLEERKKPIEIKSPGKFVLSNTENGESSVLYEPNFYSEDEAWELFECLQDSTEWLDKSIVIHGIEYPQPRLVAWYGPLPYSYSGTTLEPAEMPECVLAIKSRVEDYLKGKNINVELNSVLLNLYRNNKDSVSWHSDDEFTMGVCPTIASISLGEIRKFEMRPKSNRLCEDENNEYFVHLNNGSLIIMDGCMQEDWQHRVPKEYHDRNARINLTFRTVYKFENGSPYSNSRINNYKPVDREIPKNPSRVKIDLDEENFPPLSSVSDSMNSKTTHKTYEKVASSKSKNEINTNKISEKESEMNYPGCKSSPKINDTINNSEEEWTVETPPSIKTTSRINDKINASEEEWEVRTPVSARTLFKTNDTVGASQEELATKSLTSNRTFHKRDDVHKYVKEWDDETPPYQNPSTKSDGTASESKEELTIKSLSSNRAYREAVHKDRNSENSAVKHTFSSNRAPPDTNYGMNAPEEEWDISSPVKNNSHSEFGEINKSHFNSYEESTCISQETPPESNNKSHKDWYEESSQNEINQLREEKYKKSFDCQQQTSLESDKMYRSNEGNFEKAYRRQTPLESNKVKYHEKWNVKSSYTRPNQFQSEKTYKYHEERAAKPFNKRNMPFETNRFHRHNERGATEPFHSKNISRRENNFKSDEVKRFESRNIERSIISNENIDAYEEKSDKNQNYNSKERRNDSSNFAGRSMRKIFSDIRNESGSNRSNGWRPNVKAEEFIPGRMNKLPSEMHRYPSSVDSSTFGHFSLIDLLNYDVDLMPSDDLKNYANALKLRVLNSISEFEPSDTEELHVLCEITDGNQTDRNQKIICSRICALVNKTIPKPQWNPISNCTTPRFQQQAENHYLDRRFQDSS